MAGNGEHTWRGTEKLEDEEMEGTESEEDEDKDEIMDENEEEGKAKGPQRVYMPGVEPLKEGEELVMDQDAYILYHQAQTGSPCLSFDVIPDTLGDSRSDYPMTIFLCAGTQADTAQGNRLLVMKMHNLHRTGKEKKEESDSESSESEDEDEEEKKPQLELAMIPHYGGINRVRVSTLLDTPVAAVWSEKGQIEIYDLRKQLAAVSDSQTLAAFLKEEQAKIKPLFSFSGHMTEGFAMDWSPKTAGQLITGDCNKNIHLWNSREGGTWHVDQRPYTGHTKSVEDLQWSPNEATVIKRDILNTLSYRCEILFEDIIVNGPQHESEKSVCPLPQRVFFPVPGSSLMLCDYVFGDETKEDLQSRFLEMLDQKVHYEDLVFMEEKNVTSRVNDVCESHQPSSGQECTPKNSSPPLEVHQRKSQSMRDPLQIGPRAFNPRPLLQCLDTRPQSSFQVWRSGYRHSQIPPSYDRGHCN